MERKNPTTARASPAPRVLACVHCQQRKVKCDRRFPCANCVRHRVQCIPATQTRSRKRRFPERELLGRLRTYEDLLRQNKVQFEPLHREHSARDRDGSNDSDEELYEPGDVNSPSHSASSKPKSVYQAKDIWHAMGGGFQDTVADYASRSDGLRSTAMKKSWEQLFEDDDHVFLGSRKTSVDLSTLHPEPVHIFRLWQVYLDNVNPLLKVTHSPSLQGQIIEAASNVSNIPPALEALMFSIYSISLLSLGPDDARAMFGLSKEELATKYQFGCQQALMNAGFLRTEDRDCLTALFLFLVSIHPTTDPWSLSSLFSIAIRIAQRIGIHSESALAKCSVFEAEMRRRLWWALVLIDARFGELADSKSSLLGPIWDCKVPLNVNDSDLRPDMKEAPRVQGKATDALFAVLRCELADFIRHAPFYLDFTNPAFKAITKAISKEDKLTALENRIEAEYLTFCDPGNPLHFMAMWTTRAQIAKSYLTEGYAQYIDASTPQTDAQRDAAVQYAFRVLEADTKIMSSPLTKGFTWLVLFYFPFPAYIHIAQDLTKRPTSSQAAQAWKTMSDNYDARFTTSLYADNPLFRIFSKVILQAWDVLESVSTQIEQPVTPPRIVASIKQRITAIAHQSMNPTAQQCDLAPSLGMNDVAVEIPMGFDNQYLYGMQAQEGFLGPDPRAIPGVPGHPAFPTGLAHLDHQNWASMVWALREGRGW